MGALGVWTGARGWSAGREAGSSAVTAGGAPEGHAGPPATGYATHSLLYAPRCRRSSLLSRHGSCRWAAIDEAMQL